MSNTKELRFTKKDWATARKTNSYSVIKLEDLPDDCPVLAVNEFPNKSMADFHLAEYVLVPNKTKLK